MPMDSMRILKTLFLIMIIITIIAVIAVWNTESLAFDKNVILGDLVKITCYEDRPKNFSRKNIRKNKNIIPTIYFITPTYPRREQIPELIRLGQTLKQVENLHWIVADDNTECNPSLIKLLKKFGIPLTVMASPMPKVFWKRDKNKMPRGVANRRAALSWIRNNAESGVLYFGDDDNTFDLEIFEEIRYTKKVSMMPVGLIDEYGISSPVVKEGKVIGFFDSWQENRKFPIDMAGFAVSVEYLKESPEATMPFKVGYEEDIFLQNLGLRIEDIEPVADQCTKILVWHTQTINKPQPNLRISKGETGTSLDKLLKEMHDFGIATSNNKKRGVKTYYTKDNRRTEV